MKNQQLVYVHGGEAFDRSLEGFSSVVRKNLKNLFKHGVSRWPDALHSQLPSWDVLKLKMPGKYNAKYTAWKKHFEAQFDTIEDEVVLLGWSLGANFLAKYLSENQFPKKIKSLHLVAGCYGCRGGFGIYKKFTGVTRQCDNIHIYHSKDDFVVPYADGEKYHQALSGSALHIFNDRNHFLRPDFLELTKSLEHSIASQ